MKKFIIICAALLLNAGMFAQAPEKMSYQAIIRNGSNALVTSSSVAMKLSILRGSESGTVVYAETQIPTTNANGLVSIEIGAGAVVSGTFSSIDWLNGPYFIKTETDPTGGTSYTIIGISQLLSVPYALYAKTAQTIMGTVPLAIGDSYGGGIIFWLDASGQHGLIAAEADQSIGVQWNNGSYTTTNAVRDGIGAGIYNTERIIANQGPGSYAAQLCAAYKGGGYGDWYLPSKIELNLLYLQKAVVGSFLWDQWYWSSTEETSNDAAWVYFDIDYQGYGSKDDPRCVRAIRVF